MHFPGGSDSDESACNVEDPGLIPRSGRSPGEGHGNALQYSWCSARIGQRSLVGSMGSHGVHGIHGVTWVHGSMRSQRVRHDWEPNTFTLSYICVCMCVCVFFFIFFPIIVYPWMPLPLALTPSAVSFVVSRVFLFSSPSSHPEKLWLSLHRLSCMQMSPQPLSVLWAYKSPQRGS